MFRYPTYFEADVGVMGGVAPNGVFFSCTRCGGEPGAEPAPSVRACVRASGGALGGPKRYRNIGFAALGLPNVGFLMVSQFFWASGPKSYENNGFAVLGLPNVINKQ